MANFIPKIEYTHPTLGATTITFTLPPERDPLNERKRANGTETRSNAGKTQYQFNYSDQEFDIRFVFLTSSLKDDLETLFDDHAAKGGSFNYFPSNDEVDFFTVVLGRKEFRPQRIVRDGADFIYDIRLNLRVDL